MTAHPIAVNVFTRKVGVRPADDMNEWPNGWPVPSVGDHVVFDDESADAWKVVRVEWHPDGVTRYPRPFVEVHLWQG